MRYAPVFNGGERIRTADLCVANALLSRLSYTPKGGILPPFLHIVPLPPHRSIAWRRVRVVDDTLLIRHIQR